MKHQPFLHEPILSLKTEINVVLVGLTIASCITRLWRLEEPRQVVFDEMHFGLFTSFYLRGIFFFDVHPPLGKLLIAGAGYVAGANTSFKFEHIGDDYPCDFPIWHLRLLPAASGCLLVPLVYLIVTNLGYTHWSALLVAVFVLFDNALITESRFILLDSILLFFTFSAVLSLLKFRQTYHRSFSLSWWLWLFTLGLSVACALSVKYSAVFMVAIICLVVLYDAWQLVGNNALSARVLLHHFLARLFALVVVPLLVYIAIFYLHLSVVSKAGPHDNQMTSAFSTSLEGGLSLITKGQPSSIIYGSQVTLRHTHNHMCWLHSHLYNYPFHYDDGRGSSGQQQVTCYSFKDVNNWWIVKDPASPHIGVANLKSVHNGDLVQLVHGTSRRCLNSHDVAAPMNPHYMEVSAYIDYNISISEQSLWKVVIVNADTEGTIWKAITSHIRLVHVNTSQMLQVTSNVLPEWGFHQLEVATGGVVQQDDNIWNVEEHQYAKVSPSGDEPVMEPPQPADSQDGQQQLNFWGKFAELQVKMLTKTFDIRTGHRYRSSPLEWPLTQRGIAFWIHRDSNKQIHLLGNPVTWCASTVSVVIFSVFLVAIIIRRRRHCQDMSEAEWERLLLTSVLFLGGWAFNYLPYFFVDRTLFLHHYFPALLCKIILLGVVVEWVHVKVLRSNVQRSISTSLVVVLVAMVIAAWHNLLPFTYGHTSLTASQILAAKWMDTWGFLIQEI